MDTTQTVKSPSVEREVYVHVNKVKMEGTLVVPEHATGIVLFAHGSGSSRHSPRNRFVAGALHSEGLATLLFDLLTHEEERLDEHTGHLRFNIPLLAERLVGATNWLQNVQGVSELKVGYFGASTGAAAALVAAARQPQAVAAVVSRGGRPDLAGESLETVWAPTLLIVGGDDEPVIDLNRLALATLASREKKLVIVPGATHLFEEPGALEEVARLAGEWFVRYLTPEPAGSTSRWSAI